MAADFDLLDQLSTSQTKREMVLTRGDVADDEFAFIASQFEQAKGLQTEKCDNGAPFIFFVDNAGRGHVVQGCCNSWTCARCGHLRALHEYGRMVEGARQLAKDGHALYFMTLTCRGADMPLATANAECMKWTNRLLTNCRTDQKRRKGAWFYAQVTERQQRGHPHSHLITTFRPKDAISVPTGAKLASGALAKRECLDSAWLVNACTLAGLGRMVDLTEIRSPVAVAVYVAKYLFKDALQTTWPKNWKRIRYSQSWPKLQRQKPAVAFPLLKLSDWQRMENLGMTVHADSEVTLEMAYARAITCVVYKQKRGV